MVPGLAYIVFRCTDLEVSRAFYEALGLVFVAEQHGEGPRHLSCDMDGVVLELYPRRGGEAISTLRIGLYSDEPQTTAAAARALGGQLPSKRATVLRDPDGRTVEVLSRARAKT